jgi:hypothetical protein
VLYSYLVNNTPEVLIAAENFVREIKPLMKDAPDLVIAAVREITPLMKNAERLIEHAMSLTEITTASIMQQGFNELSSMIPRLSSLMPEVSSVKLLNPMEKFASPILPELKQQGSLVMQQVNVIHHLDINFRNSLHVMQSNSLNSYALKFFNSIQHNHLFILPIGFFIVYFGEKILENTSSWISSCIDSLKKPLTNLNHSTLRELIWTITPTVILIASPYECVCLLFIINDIINLKVLVESYSWYLYYTDYNIILKADPHVCGTPTDGDTNTGIGENRGSMNNSTASNINPLSGSGSGSGSASASGSGSGSGNGDGSGDAPDGWNNPQLIRAHYIQYLNTTKWILADLRNVFNSVLADIELQEDPLLEEYNYSFLEIETHINSIISNIQYLEVDMREELNTSFWLSGRLGFESFTLEEYNELHISLHNIYYNSDRILSALVEFNRSLELLNIDPSNINNRNEFILRHTELLEILNNQEDSISTYISRIRSL